MKATKISLDESSRMGENPLISGSQMPLRHTCYTVSLLIAANIFFITPLIGQTQPELKKDKRYRACMDGPKTLNELDSLERELKTIDEKSLRELQEEFGTQHQTGPVLTPEDLAEIFVFDCSDLVGRLSAGATVTQSPALSGAARFFQEKLDYMKWWLQNRREKSKQ